MKAVSIADGIVSTKLFNKCFSVDY